MRTRRRLARGLAILLLPGVVADCAFGSPGGWDSAYAPNIVGGAVNAMAFQPDGKLLIGGAFSSVNSSSSRFHLARLMGDGSLDTNFFNTGSGVSSTVWCLAEQTDGRIVIGGDFTSVNGTGRTRVARLNVNGTVDGSFIPTNTINSSVLAIAAQSDNKVIIGGTFSGGTFPSWNARLNADGTLDTAFSSFPNGPINAIAIQPDGKIVVGGSFTTLNGATRNRIGRLNADGSLDNTFQNGQAGALSTVRCLQIQVDGKILLGGDFTAVNNTSRSFVARLNSDGTLDGGFNSSVGANAPVYSVATQTDNTVVIGGNFSTYASVNSSRVARLYPDGSRDTAFSAFGINNIIQALAVQSDGALVIGGTFTIVSNSNRSFLARLYGNLYPPEFIAQPISRSTNVGATVTFSALVNNPTPSAFQWRKEGSNISGATGTSYSLFNVQFGDAGNYSVFVSNGAGGATSSNAVLQVGVAPAITQQPASLVVTQGQAATFAIGATGAPLSYFWKKNGAFIPGATNTSLTFASAVFTNGGTYTCVVSNFLGNVTSSNAVLTVTAPPTITVQPAGSTVAVGSNFTLTITAIGTAPLVYQWFKDGGSLLDLTNSAFTVTSAQQSNSGGYSAVVTNILGSITSLVAQVNVGFAPAILVQPQPLTNSPGTSNAFNVAASGSEPLLYQWFKDGIALTDATNVLLALPNVQSNQVGYYSVTITNLYGWVVSSNALLSIPGVPLPFQWLGLVAYYPFSGNANDVIGTNNGTPVGAVLTTDRFGGTNKAYAFDGVNNYISFGGIPLHQTDNWSVAGWMNPASLNQLGYAVAVGYDDGTTGDGFAFGIAAGSGVAGNGLWGVYGEAAWIDGGYSFASNNRWYQVVMLRDSGVTKFFINGVQSLSTSGLTPIMPGSFTIGSASGIRFFNGSVDEVRIYNRALSSSEVAQLYSFEADIPVIMTQPQGEIVSQGNTVMFQVVATAQNPLVYQWNKDGIPVDSATNTILLLTNVQPLQAGLYTVNISNGFTGILTAPAALTVMTSVGAGAPRFTSNQFGFSLSGATGGGFVVEASSDLRLWTPLSTNTFGGGPFQFVDPSSSTNPVRFYRARY